MNIWFASHTEPYANGLVRKCVPAFKKYQYVMRTRKSLPMLENVILL